MKNLVLVSFLVGLSISCKPPTSLCGIGSSAVTCAMGEECVSDVCTNQRYAFLSTGIYKLTSASNADNFCQQEADAATSAVTGKKFMAWIATTQQSPLSRVLARMNNQNDKLDVYATDKTTKISGPIHAGTQILNDFADTSHFDYIQLAADGRTSSGGYFVQTGSQNSLAAAKSDGSENCKDWVSNNALDKRIVGVRDQDASNYYRPSEYNWYNTIPLGNCPASPCSAFTLCSNPQPIYCVQVDK